MLIRDDPDLFATAAERSAERFGLDVFDIEKDYWLTEMLRAVSSAHRGQFLLKGGTSLSKGYGLIHRFSEDVDLLLVPQAADSDGSAVEDLLSAVEVTLAAVTGTEPHRADAEEGVATVTLVSYESVLGTPSGKEPLVRVDHGVPGGVLPSETRRLSAMIGDAFAADRANYEDLADVSVDVLQPARTLVEKLCIVSNLGERIAGGNQNVRSREVRHLYDIYCLLDGGSPAVRWLAEHGTASELYDDCARITERFYGTSPVRPPAGFSDSRIFVDDETLGVCERSYAKMLETFLYRTSFRPSLTDVADRVRAQAHLL